MTAPAYACRWLVACWGAGGGGASDGSRQAGSGGATTLARGSVTILVGNGGAGGYAGEVNTPGATPGGGSGGVVIPGAGAAGGAGGRRFTESHGSTHSRHGHDGGAGGLAVELFKPLAGARHTLTVGAGGAGGRGGGQRGSAGSRGAIAIIELR